MPTSSPNTAFINPLDVPKTAGGEPASGQPFTGFTGLRLNYPLQKLYMSGAVRRDLDGITFGSGGTLVASTAYTGWCIVPRSSLITAIYFVIGTAPTVAGATLAVTANGVTLLAGATYAVPTTVAVNTILSVPLATTGALIDALSKLPYLSVAGGTGGFPYPILCTYTEGASTVHSGNVGMFIEFEPDDFAG